MGETLRDKMQREMEQKTIFRQVQQDAFDYVDRVHKRAVFPDTYAVTRLDAFNEPLPEQSGDATQILQQLNELGAPATVANTGGRYFGLVVGGMIPASLGARWLADFWDQISSLHHTSPLSSKLEEVSEGWLKEIFNLPQETVAGFVSGSSSAILCSLAAARYRIYANQGWDINRKGYHRAPKLRIVAGRHAHATVIKAVALLGMGTDTIEWVEVDDQGRIIPEQIPQLDDCTILILQAGNVNSGAFDPFTQICAKAKQAGAWIHVDGAFGLWAAASEDLKHLTADIELADSWSVDGHKTLNTPYDSGIVLCRDEQALIHALQASGSYIVYSEGRDGMLYTPEMSRRARAIEVWAALKYLGTEGLDELISGLHARARQAAQELSEAGFRIVNEVVFNQVLVACDSNELTEATLKQIQASGECWVGGASWSGTAVIRISVCSWVTSSVDISRTVRAFISALKQARREI